MVILLRDTPPIRRLPSGSRTAALAMLFDLVESAPTLRLPGRALGRLTPLHGEKSCGRRLSQITSTCAASGQRCCLELARRGIAAGKHRRGTRASEPSQPVPLTAPAEGDLILSGSAHRGMPVGTRLLPGKPWLIRLPHPPVRMGGPPVRSISSNPSQSPQPQEVPRTPHTNGPAHCLRPLQGADAFFSEGWTS